MSEEKSSPVDQMKDWARRAPTPDGPVPDTDNLGDHLGAKRMVVVLMDDRGQAFAINHVDLKGAQLIRLEQPRSAINELMDQLGVHDGPNWSQISD